MFHMSTCCLDAGLKAASHCHLQMVPVTLSSSHYLTVDVPYVHLLPGYRPEGDVSLLPADGPRMILSFSNYLTVDVPCVHLLPGYRPQLDVSLLPSEDPQILASRVLSENPPQFDFREFPHHVLETITHQRF
jgi:hypothetical protein